MKYLLLSIFAFCCIVACRIKGSRQVLHLAGAYSVGDFKLANHPDSSAGKELEKALGSARSQFRFSQGDSVYIFPSLGMKYFGDSVFKYTVIGDTLVLVNGDITRKLPVVTDGNLIRLFGIGHDIDHISIAPANAL